MIAALYVQTNGCYFGLPDVDPWDEKRDARLYAGPWAVVAHPPCERWGRYWRGGPSVRVPKKKGDDGHRARKATWLYANHVELPSLNWGRAAVDFVRIDAGFHSKAERRAAVRRGVIERLSKTQRIATPLPFRDLLIGIARSATAVAA